jgi:hypothetical protein
VRPRRDDPEVIVVTRTPPRSKRLAASILGALIVIGAAASSGTAGPGPQAQVPSQAAQGQAVGVAVAVSPSGVRCALRVRYANGALQGGLGSTVARGGHAAWKWHVPLTAAPGTAKVTVSCGRAGSIERDLRIVARPKTPPKVTVLKQGFSMRYNPTGGSGASFGVILRNASPDQDALNVHVLVNFVNPANVVVGSVSQGIAAVPAAGTYNYGGSLTWQGAPTVSRLEIVVTVDSHAPRAQKYPGVANVGIYPQSFEPGWVGEVDGELHNNSGRMTLATANLSIVILDAAGNVVGGGTGLSFAPVPPGARILFKAGNGFNAIPIDRAATALISTEPSWRLGS